MPACHLRHDRARRKQFRDDPPLVRVTPPSPATNATANLDAPSRRGSVNYMVDHICEPMPSTGSHLPNYAARCRRGAPKPVRHFSRYAMRVESRVEIRLDDRSGGGPCTAISPRKCRRSVNVIQTHARMMPRNVLERN